MFSHDRKRRPLGVGITALAVGAALVLTGCATGGGGDATEGGDGGNLAITFLPKNLGNPYFDTSNAGGEEAIEEFGGTYAEVGPAEATPDAQVSYINTLTQQQVGALVDRRCPVRVPGHDCRTDSGQAAGVGRVRSSST